MAKGNHVFNRFDGTIYNLFKKIVEDRGQARELAALNNSGGNKDAALATMLEHYPKSYPIFGEIMKHKLVAAMHRIQDDEQVVANDTNSSEYGRCSEDFVDSAKAWVYGDDLPNPADSWRLLRNSGIDHAARARYEDSGSSQPATPPSSDRRKKECLKIELFISGELTRLIRRWLVALRADLANENVQKRWKKQLRDALNAP